MKETESNSIDAKVNRKTEEYCKYFSILIVTFSILTSKSLFENAKGRSFVFKESDLIFFLSGFLLSYLNFYLCIFIAKNYLRAIFNNKKREGENFEDKISRCGNYISGVVFYCFTTTYLVYHFYGSEINPNIFGGTIKLGEWDVNTPQRLNIYGEFIYLFHLGHSVNRLLKQFLHGKESNNFWQQIAHHLLTIHLIYYSYILGFTYWGITILFLFDNTDIGVNLNQLVNDCKVSDVLLSITYLFLVIPWMVFRIYAFSREVVWQAWVGFQQDVSVHLKVSVAGILMSMVFLQFLNFYWLFQILFVGYKRLVKKQGESSYLQ